LDSIFADVFGIFDVDSGVSLLRVLQTG